MKHVIIILSVLFLVAGCVSNVSQHGTYTGENPVRVIATYGNQSHRLSEKNKVGFFVGKGEQEEVILVDESITYQTIRGFGASLTESSASLIYNHPDRDEIMKSLFSPEEGIGISYLRQPLGASDFALDFYTYDDVPGDVELEHFSIERDYTYVIPLLKQALQLNPDLKVMGTPWTAPGWMKSGKKYGEKDLIQGFLDTDYYDVYAEYLIKTIEAYARAGIVLDAITIQNEPENFSAIWPSMYMSSDAQRNFIRILGPRMEEKGFETDLLIFDHNWNKPDYPRDVLDYLAPEEHRWIYGAAFHGYNGSPEGQSLFLKDYPDMGIFFTEICGGEWSPNFATNLRWNYENVFIGSLRNSAEVITLWNIALDEKGEPNIRQDTNDPWEILRGVITINSRTGKVSKEVEYFMLGQLAKYVKPGAIRIESTNSESILSVAFVNPDGTKVLVALNKDWTKGHSFDVQWGEKYFTYSLPVESICTFVWE